MSRILKGNVGRQLLRLTLPSIGGMLAIMVFNLTDTWYVSRLGTNELAAMGFTFPIVLLVGSIGIGFSTGSASIITRALGAGDSAFARRTVSHSLLLTILGTLIASIIGYLNIDPLFEMLGAKGPVLALVHEYMSIWFLGAVAAVMPAVCDSSLRASGDMIRPLLVMCTCALLNILLDPLFIFGLGPVPALGMRGAAIATIAARIIGTLGSLAFLHYRSRLIDWNRPILRDLLASWKQIIHLGIPATLTQALNPLTQLFYIRLAASVGGTASVAAMTTATRIEAFIFVIAIAYGLAIVPFVGQNYGARAFDRVQQTRRLSTRIAFIYAGLTLLLILPSGRFLSGLFSEHPVVVRNSALYLFIAPFGHVGLYLANWMSQLLNVIGKPRPVMLINLTRVLLFLAPLCLLGSWLFGYPGLVIGIAAGNLLAGTLAYLTARHHLRKYRSVT